MASPGLSTRQDNDLKGTLRAFQNKLWARHDHPRPERLYHYTSLAGVRGIAKNARIWTSDLSRMSTDDKDGKYMLEVIRPIINRALIDDHFRERLNDPEDLGLGDKWFVYSASFSTTHTIESQWTEYAEGGTGCAIELDCEALFAGCNDGTSYALAKVLYDEHEQRRIIHETVKHALELQRTLGIAEEDNGFGLELLLSLIVAGLRFKHSSYTEEDEWRVLMMEPSRRSAKLRFGSQGQIWYQNVSIGNAIARRILRGPACGLTATQLRKELDGTAFDGIPIS